MNGIQDERNRSLRRWLPLAMFLLALSYPLVLHAGVVSGSLLTATLVLLLIILLWGVLELSKSRPSGWLLIGVALGGGLWLWLGEPDKVKLLQLPPILINGTLFFMFSMTLLPDRTPLITRFAQLMHEQERELNTLEQRYTRRVTLFWSGMFVFLTLESAGLAIWASQETWSLFTNFINYMLVLAAMLIEYRIRVRQLPHLEHPGFLPFVKRVRSIEWRSLL
ncbi:MAG: hypothetical protein ABW076_05915 [Candidatus Thiodiazotropha sp.]